MMRRMVAVGVPILVLLVGVGVRVYLVQTRPAPERREPRVTGTVVTTMEAVPQRFTPMVRGQGRVTPTKEVQLAPEVSGRVRWVHPSLGPGTRFRKGDVILRLDDRDYQTAVALREADLIRAQAELRLEQGRGKVAQQEWESGLQAPAQTGVQKQVTERQITERQGSRALVLREPQQQAAEANVKAAQAALAQAKQNLGRTAVRAPFGCWVRSSMVEVGMVVGPQAPVIHLIGTDSYRIEAAVSTADLSKLPSLTVAAGPAGAPSRPSDSRSGDSTVQVVQTAGGSPFVRGATLVRLLGDLDAAGGMARLLVEVDDPLRLPDPNAPPLLLGSFVEVRIQGTPVEGAVPLSGAAIREGNVVYVVQPGPEPRLAFQKVDVLWAEGDQPWVIRGLQGGEQVITSYLTAPTSGMLLRTETGDNQSLGDGRNASNEGNVPGSADSP